MELYLLKKWASPRFRMVPSAVCIANLRQKILVYNRHVVAQMWLNNYFIH
jgi:hypothetical protein